jgi:phospholipid/cholesterol/gamma-HCH transport system substrate-binding protein
MANSAAETVIGAVVLIVAGGFLTYAARTADVNVGGTYELVANFRKADGVTIGGDVRISGVKVGTIRDMSLNPQTYQAQVVVAIRDGVQVPEDSAATIATDGLLGGAHVSIQPGGSEFMLEPGDEFDFTQGSVNILDLVGRAISGGGDAE